MMGDSSTPTYFTKIKTITDSLENLDAKVSEKKLVIYTLNDLYTKFEHITSQIQHHKTHPLFMDTCAMLEVEEQLILQTQ